MLELNIHLSIHNINSCKQAPKVAVYTSVFSMGYGLKSSFNICIISACVSLLIKSWITLTEAVGGRAERYVWSRVNEWGPNGLGWLETASGSGLESRQAGKQVSYDPKAQKRDMVNSHEYNMRNNSLRTLEQEERHEWCYFCSWNNELGMSGWRTRLDTLQGDGIDGRQCVISREPVESVKERYTAYLIMSC